MEKKLPDNFYWGGSVSSFQTEGARNEGGKGVCIYDVRPTDPEFSDWSVGIDEYHRYDEDIALMRTIVDAAKEAGISAVIAADVAVMAYCCEVGQEVHLSTQLNISNAGALKFYARFADVVVLARELVI